MILVLVPPTDNAQLQDKEIMDDFFQREKGNFKTQQYRLKYIQIFLVSMFLSLNNARQHDKDDYHNVKREMINSKNIFEATTFPNFSGPKIKNSHQPPYVI